MTTLALLDLVRRERDLSRRRDELLLSGNGDTETRRIIGEQLERVRREIEGERAK